MVAANLVALLALPFKDAVIMPAVNAPLASLATMASGVLALVAVVAAFNTLPAVLIVANLVSSIFAPAAILVFEIFEIVLSKALIVFAVSISVPAKVAMVPVVGNITSVAAVVLNVILAPDPVTPVVIRFAPVVIDPPSVISLVLSFATPVPPLTGLIIPVICWPPIELDDTSLIVASLPDNGSSKTVGPVVLNVMSEALKPVVPVVVKFLAIFTSPPRVIVLPVLSTPVPPLAPLKIPETEEAEILLIAVVTYCVLAIVPSLDG